MASTNHPNSFRQIGGSRWVTPMTTIKTNVTELATTTLNVGVEQFIGNRLSVSLPVSYNPWTFTDNKKIKHLAFQPEFRVWFGETFRGSFINVQSFIGVQLHYLYYNVGGVGVPFNMFPDPKTTRYQGQGAGAGVTYANQFGLGGRWRGEVGTSLVFSYLWYDSYECRTCGAFKGSGTRRYVGPGKSSLSIIYFIPGQRGFNINHHSGITAYIPQEWFPKLNAQYKKTAWYKAVGNALETTSHQ